MRTTTIVSVTRRYAGALEEFAELLNVEADQHRLERQLRLIGELAKTWETLVHTFAAEEISADRSEASGD